MTEKELLGNWESSERRDIENNVMSTREYYQHYFKPPYYKMRKMKNRGATLVIHEKHEKQHEKGEE